MQSALSHVSFQVVGGLPVALTVLLALLVLAALGSRGLRVQGRRKAVLLALRWLTALLLALMVAQPAWQIERTRLLAGKVAVLFDDSASLGWGAPGERRIDRAQALLARWSQEVTATDGSRARFFRVTSEVAPLQGRDGEVPQLSGLGTQSRLWAGLNSLATQPWHPSSLVLVSDGADNGTDRPPRDLGVPVHTVGFVDRPALRDDAVVAVEPDARVFLHTQAHVLVQLQSSGLGARELRVRLEHQGRVVDERKVRVEEGETSHAELAFMPRELGRDSYLVRVDAHQDDVIPANDSAPFVVNVVRERLRVLHVAGAPSWDQRFLRGFLKRDPALDLISFFILRSTHDMTMSDPSELALIPFPTDELFREHLSSFDVVILQNFNYGPYRMARYLPLIRDYVREGGALAMIGGPLSFDGGGYSDTPLAEVLPVRLMPSGKQAHVVEGRFVPTREAARQHHPLLDLHPDPSAAARAWAGLDKLEGANQFAGLSQHGVALWTHPTARAGGKPMPVLAVGDFGRGRTLALGTDSVWHWTVPTAGRGGDPTVYDRFWDRALRWLSRDPGLAPSQLSTDRERYGPGEPVAVRALLRGADYAPRTQGVLSMRAMDGAGEPLSQHTLEASAAGEATLTLRAPQAPGAYLLELAGDGVEPESEPFLVTEGGVELSDPRMRRGELERLASSTGGRFIENPDDAPALSELLVPARVRAGVERHAPFSTLWAGVLALLAFCLEWWLRRLWGER